MKNEYRIPSFMGFIREAVHEIYQSGIVPSVIINFRLTVNFQIDPSGITYGKYNLVNLTDKDGYKTPFDQNVDGWKFDDVIMDITDAMYEMMPTSSIDAAGMADDVQSSIDKYLSNKINPDDQAVISTLEIRVVVNTAENISRVEDKKN